MSCYRKGGCGPYEMYSCYECPASKPEYAQKYVIQGKLDPVTVQKLHESRMKVATVEDALPRYATHCLICNEDVPVYDGELGQPKICEKCKTAVMRMRKLVFGEGKDE